MARKSPNGEKIPTVSDAAAHLGVTTKTVNDWIKRGIIPEPPSIPYGTGYMKTFPPEYLSEADSALQRYRESRR